LGIKDVIGKAEKARFLKKTDGSMAVEFAMLIFPTIFLTFAIIELCLFFAASNMVEGGISASARMIRTGQLQQVENSTPEEAFREEICNHMFVLVDCNNVIMEVVALPDDDFGSAGDYQIEYDEDGNVKPRPFDAGGSSDVVLIRAIYDYKLLTPFFADVFSKTGDGMIRIVTTIVLQTEPYDFGEEQAEL
jgi:hypothetical protein